MNEIPGVNLPGVATTVAELQKSGLSPQDIGAVPAGSLMSGTAPVPVSTTHIANVAKSHEIDLLTDKGQYCCGGAFPDAHPQEWTKKVAAAQRLLLLLTKSDVSTYNSLSAMWPETHVVILQLAVYADEDGVRVTS